MIVVQDDLWLCTDCFTITETGDSSSLDYHYEKEEADKKEKEIQEGLERLGPHLVSDWDSETEEGIEEFSRRKCDCCGTRLAGGRHRYAVLGEELK